MTSEDAAPTAEAPTRSATRGGMFLTFFLASEEYGIEILKVHEIIGVLPITPVPRTPPFIRGVVNLRGRIIPVIDLRLKFGISALEQTDETCIIVVQAGGVQTGLVVDRVSEVLDIPSDEVEPAPVLGVGTDTTHILGIGKAQGRVVLLLDIDRVLVSKDLADLGAAATSPYGGHVNGPRAGHGAGEG